MSPPGYHRYRRKKGDSFCHFTFPAGGSNAGRSALGSFYHRCLHPAASFEAEGARSFTNTTSRSAEMCFISSYSSKNRRFQKDFADYLHCYPWFGFLPTYQSVRTTVSTSQPTTSSGLSTNAQRRVPSGPMSASTSCSDDDNLAPVHRISHHTRRRRIFCLLESLSLLIRTLAPVPAWLLYYDIKSPYGDILILVYITLKCLVLLRHARGCGHILACMYRPDYLEYGRPATSEELQEAGTFECIVCYENLNNNSVALPGVHYFCEPCLSEWCERERTCPLCRSAIGPNFHLNAPYCNITTPIWPCFL